MRRWLLIIYPKPTAAAEMSNNNTHMLLVVVVVMMIRLNRLPPSKEDLQQYNNFENLINQCGDYILKFKKRLLDASKNPDVAVYGPKMKTKVMVVVIIYYSSSYYNTRWRG